MSQEKNLGSSEHDITVVRASALDSPDDYVTHKGHSMDTPIQTVEYPQDENDDPNRKKKKWWSIFLEPGSAPQIIVAAVLAIAIGMAVNATVDKVPKEAVEIVGIPGRIWLRALTAVVLPLIVTCMIIAVQRLKEMHRAGGSLAKWCILWYVGTTFVALLPSVLLASLCFAKLYPVASDASLAVAAADAATIAERSKLAVHEVVVNLFDSFVTNNIVNALATNALLAVIIVATIIGYLIESTDTVIYKGVVEVDRMVTKVVSFLIKLAPVGVFFLILSNLMRLDMASVGTALGMHIGFCLSCFFLHLFIVLPLLFFVFTRFQNPFLHWFKCIPAVATAWGTASSAATLPVTMRVLVKQKVPKTIVNFAVPLGCLINMDGTAIHFPIAVTFLAATQGQVLSAADYVIITFLSTLGAIAGAPLPSAGLVLIVMIANAVNVEITGMYAVIVAIDWFLDRFRTAINVTGDLYAARIFEVQTGIKDGDDEVVPDVQQIFGVRREQV